MKQLTASLAALLILGVVVVGIVVLVALGHPVPSILETVALVAVGGQAGAALPTLFTPSSAPTLVLTQAAPAAASARRLAGRGFRVQRRARGGPGCPRPDRRGRRRRHLGLPAGRGVAVRLVVPDQRAALVGGLLCFAAGSWLLYQAYDARGRKRPLLVRLFPNL